jgi:hypothetical protein
MPAFIKSIVVLSAFSQRASVEALMNRAQGLFMKNDKRYLLYVVVVAAIGPDTAGPAMGIIER